MLSRTDNTFATATNLGIFTGRRSQSFVLRGALGPTDRADFFKITFRPGSRYRSSVDVYDIRGAGLTVSTAAQNRALTRNRIVPAGSFRLNPGRSTIPNNIPFSNTSNADTIFYIRVERPTGNLRYAIRLTLRI